MTHDQFFEALRLNEIARVYLFQGEEEYIKEKALAALRKKLLPEGLEAMNECILEGQGAGDVIAACETLPMLAERRLVVVREPVWLTAGKGAADSAGSDQLAAYLDRLPETVCLVFFLRGSPDNRKKLTAALSKRGAAVSFGRLSDAELAKWMAAQLRPHGKSITHENALLLAFVSGRELTSLSRELDKLAAYAGEREEVTREDIEAIATKALEYSVFQMVDALVEGREAEAFSLLYGVLENGEAIISVLALLARQYRNLLRLKQLKDAGVPEAELAKRIGVPPFALRTLTKQARGQSERTLRERLDLCVDTDYAIKSGRMRAEAALDRAMLLLSVKQVGA